MCFLLGSQKLRLKRSPPLASVALYPGPFYQVFLTGYYIPSFRPPRITVKSYSWGMI